MAVASGTDVAVEHLSVSAYTVPTDAPESDGTLEWDSTTIVVVEVQAGGETGLGYTYGPAAIAALIDAELRPIVHGSNAIAPVYTAVQLHNHLRNAGHPGIAMSAVSAVDIALWDLKARLLDVPLADLLPRAHESVPVYGSGGFTSYSLDRLREQLGGWVAEGIPRVKMKLGREPERDPERLDAAREAIGDDAELFVDANGAFKPKQALGWAKRYAREWGVTWFEEPVSSGELDGLGFVREHAPLEIAAGEYAYVAADFRNLLGRVDCLQADVTRCGGISGPPAGRRLRSRCTRCRCPATARRPRPYTRFCAAPTLRHLEWFHDHVRIERMFFDGFLEPENGELRPDRARPGHGLELKRRDVERFAVA